MMKNFTFVGGVYMMFLLLCCNGLDAQSTGDFRSAQNGNWTTADTWQVYNGATWIAASQYPGQTGGTYAVAVAAGTTVTVQNPITVTIGDLKIEGTILLEKNFEINSNLPVPNLYINNGTVNFIKNVNMTLPIGANVYMNITDLAIQGFHTMEGCTGDTGVLIGKKKYSMCQGAGTAGDFLALNTTAATGGLAVANADFTEVCAGGSVTLTGSQIGNSAVTDIKWDLIADPSGSVSVPIGISGTNVLPYSVNSGTLITPGQYMFRFSFQVGTAAKSDEVTVTLNPNLPASVNIAASPSNAVCPGTAVTFTAMPVNGGPSPSYQWKVNGVDVGTNSIAYTSSILTNSDVVTVSMMPDSAGTCPTVSSSVISPGATVTHQTTVFNGAWSVPPASNLSAEIRTAYSSGGSNLNFCALRITNNARVILNSGDDFTVHNGVTMDSGSMLTVEAGANLVQIADGVSNTGNITVQSDIKIGESRNQYNLLGSPVAFMNGESFKSIYAGTTGVLYYNESNNFFYNSTGVNIPGRGLAVKEPTKPEVPAGNTKVTASYKGVPQNGIINFPMVNSNVTGDAVGFNLIGNPFPSNIDLVKLYNLNGGKNTELQTVSPNISATFYFWDNEVNNGVAQTQQGSNYQGQAYAVFNALAGTNGTGTAAGSLNGGTVAGNKTPTHIVKVGQGFIARSLISSYSLKFSNSIRTAEIASADFLGKSLLQDDRYWLKLITPANLTSNMAVVYFAAGKNSFGAEDSVSRGGSDEIYSSAEDKRITINGRAPFKNSDRILLGTKHFSNGKYIISLAEKEGVFANGQRIYLRDTHTGMIADLNESDYSFNAAAGETTGRFEIIYKPEVALSTDPNVTEKLVVYRDGSDFIVKALSEKITELELYDSLGRLILKTQPNSTRAAVSAASLASGMYIIKVSQGRQTAAKKVIN